MEEMSRAAGQGMGQGYRIAMSTPGDPLSQHLHMFTRLKVLCNSFLCRLQYIGTPD